MMADTGWNIITEIVGRVVYIMEGARADDIQLHNHQMRNAN